MNKLQSLSDHFKIWKIDIEEDDLYDIIKQADNFENKLYDFFHKSQDIIY